MRRNNIFQFIVLLTCLFGLGIPFSANAAEEVIGIGLASGVSEESKQVALNKALRNAVEKSVGVVVASETVTQNFQLLEDKIYSNVSGYVESYEIIDTQTENNELTRVKIKAMVTKDSLNDDLRAIKVITSIKGNPKTMIVIDEKVENEYSRSMILSPMIKSYLMQQTFEIVEGGKHTDSVTQKDALSLSSELGNELLVYGTVLLSKGAESEAYGVKVYDVSISVDLLAITTDTGKVIASVHETGTERGGNIQHAASKFLEPFWNKHKQSFVSQILEAWRHEVYNDVELLVTIKGLASHDAKFKNTISGIKGIVSVREKTFKEGNLQLSVKASSTAAMVFAQEVAAVLPELALINKTEHTLDFELNTKGGE